MVSFKQLPGVVLLMVVAQFFCSLLVWKVLEDGGSPDFNMLLQTPHYTDPLSTCAYVIVTHTFQHRVCNLWIWEKKKKRQKGSLREKK